MKTKIDDMLIDKDKLEQVVINMDEMADHAEAFKEHDVAFNCVGTTRSDAGSAEVY